MTKFLKNYKGQFFIDGNKKTKAHFLRTMIEEKRKTYIKESKKGNFYYSPILKGEMSFFLTTKIVITKKKEKYLMWDFVVKAKKRGKKKARETQFYAIETDCNIVIYDERKFLKKGKYQFNELIKEMLETVKEEYKLEDVYCRSIVDVLVELGNKTKFEVKYSTKGYVYEIALRPTYKFEEHIFKTPLERLYFDLINKINISQSIVKYSFIKVNLLCTQVGK